MKNLIFQIKDELKKKINKLDSYLTDYQKTSQTVQIPSTAYMNWGIELAQSGKLEDAIDKFRTASMMPNQNPGIYINLGIAFLKQKNYEEAIRNFRQAVKVDKYNSKAYSMWASALSEIGDLKGAIDIYELAQKYDSRDPDIYLNWGISLARAGKKFEAAQKFKKSVSLNPLNPITSFLWGLILFEESKYNEAIDKFNHSLIYTEDKYDSLYYIALSYLKQGDYKMAENYSKLALKENSSKTEAYIALADCYLNTGEDKKCLETFQLAGEFCNVDLNFHLNWALAMQRYQKFDVAREKLSYVLEQDPNNQIALFNLGVNHLLCKEYTSAEELFVKVVEINPKHFQALFNLGAVYFDKEDYLRAIEYYLSAYSIDKSNPRMFFNIANCYYKLKDYENASVFFKKCIEYCPDFVQGYINYAHLLVDSGDLIDAERKARTAYLMDKNSYYTNFAVGVVYLKLKKYDDALKRFKRALELNNDYYIATLGIAELFARKGEFSNSLDVFDSLSDDIKASKEYLDVKLMVLSLMADCDFVDINLLNRSLICCNKFLERYNNSDKLIEIHNKLSEKINNIEAC